MSQKYTLKGNEIDEEKVLGKAHGVYSKYFGEDITTLKIAKDMEIEHPTVEYLRHLANVLKEGGFKKQTDPWGRETWTPYGDPTPLSEIVGRDVHIY